MRKKIYNYTSNLELTSLLMRIKNFRKKIQCNDSINLNHFINSRIKLHTRLTETYYKNDPQKTTKKQIVLNHLKNQIINLSEKCPSDDVTYNRFGSVILLMIKHILTKPQFSGYTYKDDFFSDAVYKILKYLGNFDHTMISKNTGQAVNAFSYISQIIHMSILFIINTRKVEQDNLLNHAKLNLKDEIIHPNALIVEKSRAPEEEKITKTVYLKSSEPISAISELKGYLKALDNVLTLNVHFLKDLNFDANQFNELRELKNVYKAINYADRY